MFEGLRQWRRKQILKSSAIPDALWSDAVRRLPFLAIYDAQTLARLREKVVLFLDGKGIVGARGHEVTPLQRVIIAIQACVLVLELDLSLYDGFENVIVYPGEFVPGWEWEDEAGVVHRNIGALAGEAMPGGPVVISWDAAAHDPLINVVIHEFAHKLDMLNGTADGVPPLHAGMDRTAWKRVFAEAYEGFCDAVDRGRDTWLDPYAAEHESEFFAVVSEAFFREGSETRRRYPDVYDQLKRFYRQDPAART